MFDSDGSAGIKGLVGAGANIVGGGIPSIIGAGVGALKELFGGVPEAVKQEGRETAKQFILGGPNATALPINSTTEKRFGFPGGRPKGEFSLWRATGDVYAVTSYSGMVPFKGAWAEGVKARWQLFDPVTNELKSTAKSIGPISLAGLNLAGGGMGLVIMGGVILAVIGLGRR